MKFILILFLINTSFSVLSNGYERSIAKCLLDAEQYVDNSQLLKVDRAYVMPHDKLIEVSFSNGAYGGFQKRDEHFNTVFYCVLDHDLNVMLLSKGLRNVFIDNLPELFEFKNEHEAAKEILFIKNNRKFMFYKSQIYNKANFLRHNPDFYKN